MRFLVIRKADANTEAGAPPTERILDAMAKYNDQMVDAGVMRFGEGLKPSSQGARVKFTRGKPAVTDGPFTETKELIAGFSLIEVDSLEEAIEWATRWPAFDSEENVELEIRPLYELSDFGTGEAVKRHARLRERMGY